MSSRPQLRLPGFLAPKAPFALPVRSCPDYVGSIVGADDVQILVVDPDWETSEADVRAVCAFVTDAINAWGGK